jgi:hypothetical protein
VVPGSLEERQIANASSDRCSTSAFRSNNRLSGSYWLFNNSEVAHAAGVGFCLLMRLDPEREGHELPTQAHPDRESEPFYNKERHLTKSFEVGPGFRKTSPESVANSCPARSGELVRSH